MVLFASNHNFSKNLNFLYPVYAYMSKSRLVGGQDFFPANQSYLKSFQKTFDWLDKSRSSKTATSLLDM